MRIRWYPVTGSEYERVGVSTKQDLSTESENLKLKIHILKHKIEIFQGCDDNLLALGVVRNVLFG